MRFAALVATIVVGLGLNAQAESATPVAKTYVLKDAVSKLPGKRIESQPKDPLNLSVLVGQITDDKTWAKHKEGLGAKDLKVDFTKQKVVYVIPWAGADGLAPVQEVVLPARVFVTFLYQPNTDEMARTSVDGWLRVVEKTVTDVEVNFVRSFGKNQTKL